jgi:FecR protein
MNEASGIVDTLRGEPLSAEAQQAIAQRLAGDAQLRSEVMEEWQFQNHLSCLLAEEDPLALWRGIEADLRAKPGTASVRRPTSSTSTSSRRMSARHRRPGRQPRTVHWSMLATALATAAMLMAVLLVGREGGGGTPAPSLQVTTVQGEARVQRADGLFVARPGMMLQPDDRIETLAGTSVDLTMGDGSRIQLAATTLLGWSGDARFRMDHGAIDVTAQPRSATAAMTITTPRALTTVVGTRFTLHHREDQTALAVSEGIVRFASDGAAVRLVHAGESAASPRPSPTTTAPAVPDPHVESKGAPRVVGFSFVDAVSGAALPGWELVTTDAIVDTTRMPAHGWTVIAITNPAKQPSVQFYLDGEEVGILQKFSPYALTSSMDRKHGLRLFEPWDPTPGNYQIKAVLSSVVNEMRPYGTPLSITLTITKEPRL